MSSIKSVCVYCGSKPGNKEAYTECAVILGRAIAEAGIRRVYGGGTIGIMGAVSNAARERGGEVLGVIPDFLVQTEAVGNIDPNHIVTRNMHERKQIMFEYSDAFIALPGGIGTLEEIVEIMTWAQMRRHSKPMVLANFDGYWEPMRELLGHMGNEGFLRPNPAADPMIIDDPEEIIPKTEQVSMNQARKADQE